jgi:hypothetical protein
MAGFHSFTNEPSWVAPPVRTPLGEFQAAGPNSPLQDTNRAGAADPTNPYPLSSVLSNCGAGYDRLGVIGIVAMLVHATGAPDFSAACSGGSSESQWTPRNGSVREVLQKPLKRMVMVCG